VGAVTFDPIGAGSTLVTADIDGFIKTTAATTSVSVTAPSMTMQGLPLTVGAGLQSNFNPFCCQIGVVLGASQHGGVTVHVSTSNPAVAVLAPNATTVVDPEDDGSIDITVPNGQTFAAFYVQGLENVAGTVTIRATAPGFTDGTGTVTITQSALQLLNLPTNTTTLSANHNVLVAVGIPSGAGLLVEQAVRAGSSLMATVSNSNATAGSLVTLADGAGQVRQVAIASGQSRSPFGVAAGGVDFDPADAGTTNVSATIPGLIATPNATVSVQVAAPPITMQGFQSLVIGAGLQTNFNPFCCQIGAVLGASGHGGVNVVVTSSNPAVALLATGATATGQTSITIPVAAGQTFAAFYIQGVATGGATITATANGFAMGSATLEVVPAGLKLEGLTTSIDATAANDPFVVTVGPMNAFGTDLQFAQPVRAGSSITVNVANSNASAAQLLKGAPAAGAQQWQVTIGANQSSSPGSAAANGVEFDPIASGATTVTATPVTDGITATDAATVNVQVTSSFAAASTNGKGTPPKKKGGG
jgi:hypothetical protein